MKYRSLYWSVLLIAIIFSACEKTSNEQNNQDEKPQEIQLKTSVPEEKPVSSNNSSKEITIASYNVENLFDTQNDPLTLDEDFLPTGKLKWTNKKLEKKRNEIAKVIASMDEDGADLFGLVEIENKECIEALLNTDLLRKHNYDYVIAPSLDRRGIDVAFCFKKGIFKMQQHDILRVAHLHSRDILYVEGMINNEKCHFFVNHWPSRRGGEAASSRKREAMARPLRTKISAILSKDPMAKIMIMGDFNDEPHNKSIKNILKAKESPDFEEKELYNTLAKKASQGKGTHSYQGKWNMLDQIIISKGWMKGKKQHYIAQSAAIYSPKWLQQQFPLKYKGTPNRTYVGSRYLGGVSDHFPVMVRCKIQ